MTTLAAWLGAFYEFYLVGIGRQAMSIDAADVITPIISGIVKQRLAPDEFNCGFRIMSHFTDLYRFSKNNEFMRFIK